jgi:hypothetical protein
MYAQFLDDRRNVENDLVAPGVPKHSPTRTESLVVAIASLTAEVIRRHTGIAMLVGQESYVLCWKHLFVACAVRALSFPF